MTEEKSELLANTKIFIRSVLQSVKGNLTTQQLDSDYKNIVGSSIPFRQLGYDSLELFLRSIPDVLTLKTWRGGSVCEAVVDESTFHIKKLIENQRDSAKSKVTRIGKRSNSSNYRSNTSFPSTNYYGNRNTTPASSYSNYFLNSAPSGSKVTVNLPVYPQFPLNLRVHQPPNFFNVQSCQSYPNYGTAQFFRGNSASGVFNKPYLLENPYVPSYKNLPPQTPRTKIQLGDLKKENKNIQEEKEKVVLEEKSPDKQENRRVLKPVTAASQKTEASNIKTESQWVKIDSKNEPYLLTSTTDISHSTTSIPCTSKHKLTSKSESNNPNSQSLSDSVINFHQKRSRTKNKDSAFEGWDTSLVQSPSDDIKIVPEKEPVNRKLKDELFELLEQYPDGIWSLHLPRLYENKTKKKFDYEDLGFTSLLEVVNAMRDVFLIFRPTPISDWLLLDARRDNSKLIALMKSENEPKKSKQQRVPDQFKRKLTKMLTNLKDGVLVHDLDSWFQNYFNESIPFKDYGFSSLDDLLKFLIDVIFIEQTNLGPVVKLLPTASICFGPAISTSKNNRFEKMLKSKPRDIEILCHIPIQEFPDNLNKYFEIEVSHVYAPDNFYIQMIGETSSDKLDELMIDLSKEYSTPESSEYDIPEECLIAGLICAVCYENENDWHRGEIVSVTKPFGEIISDINYIDFGTMEQKRSPKFKYLKKKFTKLPAQAIAAKLGNIEPIVGSQWPETAKKDFFQIVTFKRFRARLIGKTEKNSPKLSKLSLCLIDTCTPDGKELDINKMMVDKRHAQFFDEFKSEREREELTTRMQWQLYSQMLNPLSSNMLALGANPDVLTKTLMQPFTTNLPPNVNFAEMFPGSLSKTTESNRNEDRSTTNFQKQTNSNQVENSTHESKPNSESKEDFAHISPTIQRRSSQKSTPRKDTDSLKYLDEISDEMDRLKLSKKRFVKITTLAGKYDVHLILYNQDLYLTSKEVSLFCWDNDRIKNTLRIKGIKVPFDIVHESEEPDLYQELLSYQLCGSLGQLHAVTIYPIRRIDKIIDLFGRDQKEVKEAIKDGLNRELEKFDPNDSYWGNSDDGISVGTTSDEIDIDGGMEVALEVLRNRKVTIEKSLRENRNTVSSGEELREKNYTLRQELQLLNERIAMLEGELS